MFRFPNYGSWIPLKSFSLILLYGLLTACSGPTSTKPNTTYEDHPGTFKTVVKRYPGNQIDGYNLYLPPAYETQKDTAFPLIVFLQGGMGVGGEVRNILKWELPKELLETTDLSTDLAQLKLNTFIYVMPHISQGEYYQSVAGMLQLLDEIQQNYRVDSKRVYLTGLSRGGYGTWGLASKMPERFAAVAPIAGAAYGVRDYEALFSLPMWVAHNVADATVDHYRSANAVQRIEAMSDISFHRSSNIAEVDYLMHDHIFTSGSNPSFEHDAWTEVYNEPNFYKWLLRFERKVEVDELVDQ